MVLYGKHLNRLEAEDLVASVAMSKFYLYLCENYGFKFSKIVSYMSNRAGNIKLLLKLTPNRLDKRTKIGRLAIIHKSLIYN